MALFLAAFYGCLWEVRYSHKELRGGGMVQPQLVLYSVATGRKFLISGLDYALECETGMTIFLECGIGM